MEQCVYLFDRGKNLTYKKQEHIISAGIGGIRTLPKGYVSDQANELFSKYELKCLRYSPLQIERARYGPGKRGSFNINSIDVPDVLSLEPMTESTKHSYICPLGFLFKNKAYIIPQIVIIMSNSKDFEVIYLKSTYQAAGNINEFDFRFRMQEFLSSSSRNYKNIEVPYDTKLIFTCIGLYKKNWYICSTQPDFNIDSLTTQIFDKKPFSGSLTDYLGSPKPKFRYIRGIDLEYMVPIFIHAKNCFNSLILFKGCDFAKQNIFDKFRQCILTNSCWDAVVLPVKDIPPNIRLFLKNRIVNHAHVVVIYTYNEAVMALSILYGKSYGLFIIGEKYFGEAFSYAFICDFENKKETMYDL